MVAAKITVIIPVLNDTPALGRLLRQLALQRPAPLEVMVVDGGRSAVTPDSPISNLCVAAGAQLIAAQPGRGGQLRVGAAAARGDVLWFLHADAGLSPGAMNSINHAVDVGAVGGYFKFRFADPSNLTKRVLEFFIQLRCRWGAVYGDQGIFVRRDSYFLAGGFAEAELFEEVPLVRALRRQGPFMALGDSIVVDTRRWDQRGYWRQTLRNRLLACGYALGLSPARLAVWYRGKN